MPPITHCCCAVNCSLGGEGKKVIPHFPPDQGSPFLWRLGATVIRIHGARPGFLLEFCLSLSLSSYLGPLLPIVPLESSFSHKKRTSSIIANLGPFFSLSLTLSFLSFPRERGYLIFLRRSRCHLPLMVETMKKSLQPECRALLNASGRFEEGSWKSVFQPLSWWPSAGLFVQLHACLQASLTRGRLP